MIYMIEYVNIPCQKKGCNKIYEVCDIMRIQFPL